MCGGIFLSGLFMFYPEKRIFLLLLFPEVHYEERMVLIGNHFIASILQVQSTKAGNTRLFCIEEFQLTLCFSGFGLTPALSSSAVILFTFSRE